MALDNPVSRGVNFVPEYQISSIPWGATGTIANVAPNTITVKSRAPADVTVTVLTFPYVTRWIQIENTDDGEDLPVYFNEVDAANQDDTHALTVTRDTKTDRFPWRVQRLYFHSSNTDVTVSIAAGLTTIPGDMLSGSIEAFTANHWGQNILE